jgi:hypothetical protein
MSSSMIRYFKTFIIAALFMLPCTYMSAAQLSASVQQSVTQVLANPADSQMAGQLAEAIKAEIRAQGLGQVSSIAEQLLACASDNASAIILAEVVTKAALEVAKELDGDVAATAKDVGAGIKLGASQAVYAAAIEAAATAADSIDNDLSDAINEGASTVELPEIILPGGDSGDTPAVEISSGTGVGS